MASHSLLKSDKKTAAGIQPAAAQFPRIAWQPSAAIPRSSTTRQSPFDIEIHGFADRPHGRGANVSLRLEPCECLYLQGFRLSRT